MGRKKLKNKENKRERFLRLGIERTREVLNRMRILGNCANRGSYDYTREDIKKIFAEIERAVRGSKARFHFPKDGEFKL